MVCKQQAIPEEAAKKGKLPPKINIVASSSYSIGLAMRLNICYCFKAISAGGLALGILGRKHFNVDQTPPIASTNLTCYVFVSETS